MKPIKLRKQEHWVLIEALRRRLRFAGDGPGPSPITKQWTGLGSPTQYKQAVEGGYMQATPTPNFARHIGWWRLTDKGARIIAYWIGQGWTLARLEDIHDPYDPDREIPGEVL